MDFDGDGRLDLVTAGEWMPLRSTTTRERRFRDVHANAGLPPLRGWWYTLATADWNHDGHPDLVAGNLRLNYSYTSSAAAAGSGSMRRFHGEPSTDIVLTQEINGTEYPVWGLAQLGHTQSIPSPSGFPSYAGFQKRPFRRCSRLPVAAGGPLSDRIPSPASIFRTRRRNLHPCRHSQSAQSLRSRDRLDDPVAPDRSEQGRRDKHAASESGVVTGAFTGPDRKRHAGNRRCSRRARPSLWRFDQRQPR